MSTVRDKLWLFASRAHDDDIWLHRSPEYEGFSRRSRISPAEGALMLDVPNVIMIESDGIPVPYSADAYGYAESFCRMQNVLWSVTGSAGFRVGNEEKFICELAEKYPNISGAFADDFLGATYIRDLSVEEKCEFLRGIRAELAKACRPMELWLTLYTTQIETTDPRVIDQFDCLSLWTGDYKKLEDLERNFGRMEEKFPRQKKYLGIYLYAYGAGRAVPNEYMKLQCEFGLDLLRQKRADGIIFLTNCVMGIGLPSEYWVREWIDRVKDEPLD